MIAKITKAYTRSYSNGQMKAYVEWIDERGESGRTEGDCMSIDDKPVHWPANGHMVALFKRARRDGITIERQTW